MIQIERKQAITAMSLTHKEQPFPSCSSFYICLPSNCSKLMPNYNIFLIHMTSHPPLPEKITQLQCHECNLGLQSIFLNWLNESFKFTPTLLAHCHQELEALLGAAEFAYTVGRGRPQAGDFLQNIEYQYFLPYFRPLSKTQKTLYFLVAVVVPYLLKRITAYAANKDSAFWKGVHSVLTRLQRFIAVGEFVNYAVFILKGEFRTLAQRVLGMKMQFIDPNNKRILNFSLMNRMLVWQVYELFLKTVLPHVFSFCAGPLKNLFYLSSFLQPDSEKGGCVVCAAQLPVMPRQALPCRHTACYYCATSTKLSKCPLCSQPIDRWAPLH